MDEISPSGPTQTWIVRNGQVEEQVITPNEFNVLARPLEMVRGGEPAENAGMFRRLVGWTDAENDQKNGDTNEGDDMKERLEAVADFIVMNAAAALYIAGEFVNVIFSSACVIMFSSYSRSNNNRYGSRTQECSQDCERSSEQ